MRTLHEWADLPHVTQTISEGDSLPAARIDPDPQGMLGNSLMASVSQGVLVIHRSSVSPAPWVKFSIGQCGSS